MLTMVHAVRGVATAALLLTALGACQDAASPTAPLDMQPRLTQVASSPVVNSSADPGDGTCDDTQCTLREAINFASSGATITFAPSVTDTITLTDYIQISKSLTITGPGVGVLAISGGGTESLFWPTSGNVVISGLTLTNAYHSFSTGGAVLVSNPGTTLTLTNCAITNSNGGALGGGIKVTEGNVTVSSCTLSGNTASNGGAIFAFAGSTKIINTTISGNTGTAIDFSSGTLGIDHASIIGNTGGGVYANGTGVSVKGSIIWGNTDGDVGASVDNAFTSLGYNLIGTDDGEWVDLGQDFTSTGDQTGVTDAKLAALALNSPGVTSTHALLSGSPAIDAGVCTDLNNATLTVDQRGVSRPQGSACDIGAYEKQVSGETTPTFVFSLSTLPEKTYGDGDFSIGIYATTNSTGAITFSTGTGSVGCSVTSGGTVSVTGAAVDPSHCIVEATLAADATYTGAGPISQSFNIAKATGSVTISNIPLSAAVGGSFAPTYTISGDGTGSTVSNSTGVCTVTSGVVNYIAAGTCLLQASVTEGPNHLAATGTEQSFVISLAIPTFAFDLSALPTKTYGDGSFSIAGYATTNSTGTITFATASNSIGCSVTSAGMVTITGAAVDPAHCVITATLAADATYAGAGPLEQSVNIEKAAGSVSIANAPSSPLAGSEFTPTFTKAGDGAATVSSLTPAVCTVSGGVVTFITAGTCTLQASVGEGTNHLAAAGSQQNITVLIGVFSSSCSYVVSPKNGQLQVTVIWENATPGVTRIQVTDGRTVTKQMAPTTSGSWSTGVKTGIPTYGLWGGTSRKDTSTTLVAAGTACSG